MNPNNPYGHVPGIAWGTDPDGLVAEYGRLRRCLSTGMLAPAGKDVFDWRHSWMKEHQKRNRDNEERLKQAGERMKMLQGRMMLVNTAIYRLEVGLGRRAHEPLPSADTNPKKYRDVPLLIRELRIERSALGDQEFRHNVHAPPTLEKEKARDWNNNQIERISRGLYRASDSLALDRPQDNKLSPILGDADLKDEDEEDDPAYMKFITQYTTKIDLMHQTSGNNSRERRLYRLQRERYQLRRIIHALELEITHHTVRKSELAFQRSEQHRVTHYWCRMNQIRALLHVEGREADINGDGKVIFDEKRARAATPPPRAEPCPW